MKEKIIRWIKNSHIGTGLLARYSILCYLRHAGWFKSLRARLPVDGGGKPLPWYTYPFIEFVRQKVSAEMKVFEFGSGNSTLWWSERVSYVSSCEHDYNWYSKMRDEMPENVEYIFCPLDSREYHLQPSKNNPHMKYDCIVIDGRERVLCVKYALESLTDAGVIIWDNSEREKYREGYEFLYNSGFRRVDFTGLGPLNPFPWCTSVFYRDNNCFGL